jgi:hypothetical protein
MKNIHLIATPNPSRLAILGMSNTLQLFDNLITFKTFGRSPQNIYITNSEEIKEGDWVYYENGDLKGIHKVVNGQRPKTMILKKIILTTDQDLIKDGVQAIDDEFLEWFVKNPSCEFVEIANDLKYFNVDELRERHIKGLPYLYFEKIGYKIIIPKEEPKQDLEKEMFELEQELDIPSHLRWHNSEPKKRLEKYSERFDNKDNEVVEGVFNPENWGRRIVKEPKQDRTCTNNCSVVCGECQIFEPKQETLEEVVERLPKELDYSEFDDTSFRLGVKWQQEQDKKMYSEEDMLKSFMAGIKCESDNGKNFEQFIKQFKKK